jgi:CspA family cold shock protein
MKNSESKKIRSAGVVEWFNDSRGYGYIRAEGDDRGIFVHYSSIVSDGFKTLAVGDRVLFDLVENKENVKKPIALNVKKMI